MSADVQQALLTFFGTVISGIVGLIAIFAKQHWNVQNDATRNAAIAAYATRLAPFLVKELGTAGTDILAATTNHPVVKAFAGTLIDGYPDFAKGIGLTPASAANFVLSEAIKYSQLTGATVSADGSIVDASATAPVSANVSAPVKTTPVISPFKVTVLGTSNKNDDRGIPPPSHLENHENA